MQTTEIQQNTVADDLSEGHAELIELVERGKEVTPLCQECWLARRGSCFILRGIVTGIFPKDLGVVTDRRQLSLAA
jgi:hypothetical protein